MCAPAKLGPLFLPALMPHALACRESQKSMAVLDSQKSMAVLGPKRALQSPAAPAPKEDSIRSYSNVLADLPEPQVSDLRAAAIL